MSTVMVVGAGLMGSGIAQVSAIAGHDVILRDISLEAVAKGRGAIEASLARFAEKGAISAEDAEAALARITGTTDLDGAAQSDIIVEAIIEEVDLKAALFADLDRLAPQGAILATNTSAIPITRIAAATQRPEAVVGTHFFSPVPMMKLCELVRGLKTSDETLAAARTWAEGIGKTCIVVNRDVAGFVTTRIITALVNEAIRLRRDRRGHAGGRRHRLQARLRPRDGPAGHRRPHRASTSCAGPRCRSTTRPRRRRSTRRS